MTGEKLYQGIEICGIPAHFELQLWVYIRANAMLVGRRIPYIWLNMSSFIK